MQANGKKQDHQDNVQIVVREVERAPVAAEVDVLSIIEKRNAMLTRILEFAIGSTHAGQWVDQGGKPWPTAPAAEVMARRCAVRVDQVHTEKVPSSDDKGAFYMYVATCTASLPGGYDSIQAMGTCSSRDTFLGTETRSGRPLSEIDEGNILKAAYSNMLVNAITRLLGVRNLTWELLAKYGIGHEAVAKVEYQSGARGAAAADAQPTVKFGKDKGKKPSELDDGGLAWHMKAAMESVAKNDPKWHQKNVDWLKVLEAEKARRGAPPPTTNGKKPWDEVVEILTKAGKQGADIASFVKGVTGKQSRDAVTADDVAKVIDALTVLQQEKKQAEIPM